jgi:hypothetical protein
MALRMVITFHWSSVCYHRNQKPVTGKCFHYNWLICKYPSKTGFIRCISI